MFDRIQNLPEERQKMARLIALSTRRADVPSKFSFRLVVATAVIMYAVASLWG